MSTERSLIVPLECNYYTFGNLSDKTTDIWIVFHGYGQLARYFIKHFEGLDQDKHYIIAPQGLSKYYLQNMSDRVGASWMTKDNREMDIRNQSVYLNQVLEDAVPNNILDTCRVNVLAFSQGVATACRWMINNKISVNKLIVWAGSLPFEHTAEDYIIYKDSMKLYCVLGDEDEYISKEQGLLAFQQLQTYISNSKFLSFQGKHQMDRGLLAQIASEPHL